MIDTVDSVDAVSSLLGNKHLTTEALRAGLHPSKTVVQELIIQGDLTRDLNQALKTLRVGYDTRLQVLLDPENPALNYLLLTGQFSGSLDYLVGHKQTTTAELEVILAKDGRNVALQSIIKSGHLDDGLDTILSAKNLCDTKLEAITDPNNQTMQEHISSGALNQGLSTAIKTAAKNNYVPLLKILSRSPAVRGLVEDPSNPLQLDRYEKNAFNANIQAEPKKALLVPAVATAKGVA